MLNLFSVLMSLRDGPVPSRDAMQCNAVGILEKIGGRCTSHQS